MANVVLKNIYKVYDKEVIAVDNISLEVVDKEFVVLVGPSGCGKSTTQQLFMLHMDQTEAMTLGDRIVVMKAGVVQQVDTPQRIFNKPANIFVAGL